MEVAIRLRCADSAAKGSPASDIEQGLHTERYIQSHRQGMQGSLKLGKEREQIDSWSNQKETTLPTTFVFSKWPYFQFANLLILFYAPNSKLTYDGTWQKIKYLYENWKSKFSIQGCLQ